MPDQQQRMPGQEAPWNKQEPSPFGEGPRSVKTPDTSLILKKLKRVESDQPRDTSNVPASKLLFAFRNKTSQARGKLFRFLSVSTNESGLGSAGFRRRRCRGLYRQPKTPRGPNRTAWIALWLKRRRRKMSTKVAVSGEDGKNGAPTFRTNDQFVVSEIDGTNVRLRTVSMIARSSSRVFILGKKVYGFNTNLRQVRST
jgi:hypothetical protein